MNNIDIIGACSDLGVHVDGAKYGPEAIERNINLNNINNIYNVHAKEIKKDLSKDNLRKNLNEINEYNSELYSVVLNSLNNNMFPITLGGDHSIAVASGLASIKRHDNLGIIWFDAHGDYHTFKTTISGNIHGLPFAALTHYEDKDLADFHSGNFYNPKNAVLVGGRDIDRPDEIKNLKDAGVTIFTTEDIHKYGPEVIYQKAFDIASNGTNGVHVSYDLDVIDPIIAPGVSIPADDGINLEEAYSFADYMVKNKEKIKSIDLVELNPLRDIDKKTEKIANNILDTLLSNF